MNEAARTALDATPESMQPGVPQADAGFLWDFWYPAMRSDEIYGKHLATAMLLEVPLVIGRTSEGKAFAMRDACPHRGFPLSYGHFDGKDLQCSYHGWEFDACSGQCVLIPSLTSHDKLKVECIAAGHYPWRRARRVCLGVYERCGERNCRSRCRPRRSCRSSARNSESARSTASCRRTLIMELSG